MEGDHERLSLLLSALEELPTGIRVARAPACDWVYTNRTFQKMVGEGPYRLIDRAGRPYPRENLPISRVAQERRPVVVDDMVVARADGTQVNLRAFGYPLYDGPAGEMRHIVVAFHDITLEVQAAAEGATARERLHAALHHAPIIMFAIDRSGTITLSEGAALRAMGYQSHELVGKTVHELYGGKPQIIENTERALAGETLTSFLDLGNVMLESWMTPVRDASGQITGLIGVSTDVTERLRLERQVAQADRLAAVGRLAASVAHEINNPLAYTVEALRLGTELLDDLGAGVGRDGARPPELLARLRRLLGEASEGAERVRLTMRDLKSFSRADEDNRRPLELNQCVATAIKLVAKRTGTRATVDRRLGPSAVVRADENRLIQILVNLILNAADALPADRTDRNRIRVSTRREGSDVAVVEVADNGPGVPADVRERVFEPFFSTKPVGEGTGLGLFVTRNLVAALGGEVTLGDAPEGGALFSVRLPVDESAVVAPTAAGAGQPQVVEAGKQSANTGRFSVLIIDDDPQVSELLRLSIEREFPEAAVRAFMSGAAALEHLLAGQTYDLVFCDLMMGEITGADIHAQLQARAPGRERDLVFMTGGVFDPALGDFLASVPNDCVDKPFDIRAEVRKRLGR